MKLSFVFAFAILLGAGCGLVSQETSTPAQAMKNYTEAALKGDVAKLREAFSQNSLKQFDEAAQAQNITVEQNIKNISAPAAKTGTPETRNERIEADAATLEVKNTLTGEWETIPFVKEGGRWKIAADRYREQILKE
ncbi:MAG TPA: nuclear transport factor 2 family protein [Pyrinomonadaceae bacterium]|nr:nuclear transport factor 2 family protein [Pyrinomonadaceae bacterium]